jgi:hypothetical protein
MMGPMVALELLGVGRVLSLVIVQCIGAMIFYHIDGWIFDE